jgi:hypothetical protein
MRMYMMTSSKETERVDISATWTPGLGKTLTTGISSSVQKVSHLRRREDTGMNSSESVAESARRPLYRVTTGELRTDVENLEKQLGDIFRLGGQMESSGIA